MRSLEDALEMVSVRAPCQHDGPRGWYAVEHEDRGIVAYFYTEADALRYRIDLVNRIVNP